MTFERLRQIQELYHAALKREAGDRAALLAQADPELRHEVESLLGQNSGAVMERPAIEVAADLLAGGELSAGAQLGPYLIEGLLGAGGMGRVYKARDTRLGRAVAIKVASERFSERFQREARAISSLNHPNVCTLYDVGPNYLVMELMEGPSLADRIKKGRIPLEETLAIARQIADGLAAAHDQGLVHRDLKPANVMVTKSGLKLLDFGIAKLDRDAPGPEEETQTLSLTHPGAVVGTIAYMSPEQASGKPLDRRSDIFSFGVVLYELLAGKRPFNGTSDLEVLQTIVHEKPQPLGDAVPLPLRSLVEKTLEKEPADRYQSMAEMVVDLRKLTRQSVETNLPVNVPPRPAWTWAAAVALALIVALGAWKFWPHPGPSRIRSIAVLPLRNLSGDPGQEFFSDGATEELISTLGQLHAFDRVISPTSVMRYKGSTKSAPEISRELGVDAVVDGSVERSGGRIRIRAHLIDASTDAQLWSQDYDSEGGDLLGLEAEVARRIADDIRLQVTPEERARLTRVRRIDPEAYEAYSKGRFFWNKRTSEDLKKAIGFFQQAIAKDPEYALAYDGLADCWLPLGWYGLLAPSATFPQAKDAIAKALRLDDSLAEAHTSLAFVDVYYDRDWTGAEREFRRGIELNPNYANGHHWYAEFLSLVGRHKEAIAESERARELDPLSSIIDAWLSSRYFFARQYDRAIQEGRNAAEMDPRFGPSRLVLGQAYEQKGMLKEAIAELETACNLGCDSIYAGSLAHAYGVAGRRAEAFKVVEDLLKKSDQGFVSSYDLAIAYLGLGNDARVFELLNAAVKERSPRVAFLGVDPRFDHLRRDPRFGRLLPLTRGKSTSA